MALFFVIAAGTLGMRHLAAALSAPAPVASNHRAAAHHSTPKRKPGNPKKAVVKASNPKTAAVLGSTTAIASLTGCGSPAPKHPGLETAGASQLRKLAEYETVCGGSTIDRLGFFVSMPTTATEARAQGAGVAATLKEFARFNIAPLVYLEPTTDHGLLDLKAYRAGRYDEAMNAYYTTLKAAGITDSMMGMWVLLPEGNLPEWSSIDPADFAANVTKTAQLQKAYFPKSLATILLDGATYPTTANGWNGGQYISLLPFITGIPAGLLDSFGLQGFPWASPANQSAADSLYDPAVYLPVQFAAEAARALGTTKIWLNTGSFAQAYAHTPGQTVTPTVQQRQAWLHGALTQAAGLQNQGFQVSMHLFAENKASTAEAIDWSYWHNPATDTGGVKLFQDFARDSQDQHIALWLYDSVSN